MTSPEQGLSPTLDAVSRLLLADGQRLVPEATRVAVVEGSVDLSREAEAVWPEVRSHHDRVDAGPSTDTLTGAVQGAELVLLHLPASLPALKEQARTIAAHAAPDVLVVTAGRSKHMTPRQNDVLASAFEEVQAQRGVGKCRAVHARKPRAVAAPSPRTATEPHTGLTLVAHGPVFAGARLDRGTRLLLGTEPDWPRGEAIDLGCGNGVLTTVLARRGNTTTGIDVSRAAVASTRATLAANELTGTAVLADGLTEQPTASADLVVTNPPFHVGTAKDSSPTLAMLRDAARVLRPGGELWCVYNSHLPYRQIAREVFARVDEVARDREFTVIRATGPR
ncbi:class I SAM-dependent methyltransferase [Kytococcus sp. Marseille-QA3725]